MYRQLPNQLTIFRLVLAAVFFLVLGFYRFPNDSRANLMVAMILFIVAASTDFLDGYLARRWHVESTFGRIMDPFCDKVLVIGAFIYLAGPRFVDPAASAEIPPFHIVPGNMASGVYPWMVVVVLARELLVTNIRGEMEDLGVKFGANLFGKLKMILQAVAVPLVLFIVWLDPTAPGHAWLAHARDAVVYLTVAVTAASGFPYITQSIRAVRGKSS